MVASLNNYSQFMTPELYTAMNNKKVAETFVESTQRYNENHSGTTTQTTNELYQPNADVIQDVLHLSNAATFLEFAAENPDITPVEKLDWGNVFAQNQRLQQPLEASKLLQRVTAVNTYKMTK